MVPAILPLCTWLKGLKVGTKAAGKEDPVHDPGSSQIDSNVTIQNVQAGCVPWFGSCLGSDQQPIEPPNSGRIAVTPALVDYAVAITSQQIGTTVFNYNFVPALVSASPRSLRRKDHCHLIRTSETLHLWCRAHTTPATAEHTYWRAICATPSFCRARARATRLLPRRRHCQSAC